MAPAAGEETVSKSRSARCVPGILRVVDLCLVLDQDLGRVAKAHTGCLFLRCLALVLGLLGLLLQLLLLLSGLLGGLVLGFLAFLLSLLRLRVKW